MRRDLTPRQRRRRAASSTRGARWRRARKPTPRPQPRDTARIAPRAGRKRKRPGPNCPASAPCRARGAAQAEEPPAGSARAPPLPQLRAPASASVPGAPGPRLPLALRGGTLASYSTRALVGSGSKHSTFSPEWNLNFMPSLALICSSWRRARLRGGRSARGGAEGWGRVGGAQRRGWGRERGMAEAAAAPPSVPPLPAPRRCRTWEPPGARTPARARLRGSPPGFGEGGLPAERRLPSSWERRLTWAPRRACAVRPGRGRRLAESLPGCAGATARGELRGRAAWLRREDRGLESGLDGQWPWAEA